MVTHTESVETLSPMLGTDTVEISTLNERLLLEWEAEALFCPARTMIMVPSITSFFGGAVLPFPSRKELANAKLSIQIVLVPDRAGSAPRLLAVWR